MDPTPDRQERGLRLGCGAVFGLALGLPLLIESLTWGGPRMWIGLGAVVGLAVVCAVLARNQGDEFWWSYFERRWWR